MFYILEEKKNLWVRVELINRILSYCCNLPKKKKKNSYKDTKQPK